MKNLGLTEFQRLFKKAVKTPFCALEGTVPDPAQFGARGHFEVYRNAYRVRITHSLAEDFPRVLDKLGEPGFDLLVSGYLSAKPSSFWTLAEISDHLPQFLREDARWKSQPDLADLADLDWLENLAFLAPELPIENQITAEELQKGLTPEMILRAHPSVHLSRGQSNPGSSDSVPLAWKHQGQTFLSSVSQAEAELLQKLRAGMPVLNLLNLLENSNWDEARVQKIFSTWTADGVLLIEREK